MSWPYRSLVHLQSQSDEDESIASNPMAVHRPIAANGSARLELNDGCRPFWQPPFEADATNPRLTTFVNYHQRMLAIRKDCFFLSYPYLNVLFELAKSRTEQKRISVTGVGLETDVPPTTVLRALGELEDVGIVERVPDPSDKRRVYVDLTAQGVKDVSEISDKIMQIVATLTRAADLDDPPCSPQSI